MADVTTDKNSPAATAKDSRATAVGSAPDAQPRDMQARSSAKHKTVAATLDELMAGEARANLKRARESTREDQAKYKPRSPVPPARIIVRPAHAHAWMTPFISLSVVVGISTFVSAGAIAYLFMRPIAASMASEAEIRSLRESVAHLRRNVAELSTNVAINRTALDATTKAATERVARTTPIPDRTEQNAPVAPIAVARAAEEAAPITQTAAAQPSDVTGTVQQSPRAAHTSRDIIPGWHIRRAYDGSAVLEGKSGIIEVTLGQDVPNIGRIQEIKYENNRWQVVTSKGVILPAR